ncbi:MAG: serine--tRNA ligase [Cyclobacteriaceae bacterium]|nr:serine--tRNA ligase [Cyclobacteriaceae bacterium]MDW8330566.1 serine--tRNA ligase [Cyclobacteriaceae bacterium]
MLQITYLREHRDTAITGLHKRGLQDAVQLIDRALEIDQLRRTAQARADELRALSNAESKKIGELMKAGKTEEAHALRQRVAQWKDELKKLEDNLAQYEEELRLHLYKIPNVPAQAVPAGKSADDNINVHQHGTMPVLPAGALPHWDLIKKYDIIDFELGNKITGAGFPVYKGKGAKLQRALISFFLDEAEKAGYSEMMPPHLVNEASGYGTGQLPDKEGQMYCVTADQLYLIPTAEVPITNLYRDTILNEQDLPVKHVGYTPCFRREAGSWGAHVRGLNRLHQFDKVEIVQIRKPEESYRALEEMCAYVQSLIEKLELPYRKMLLCGGDMGFNSAMTYDMEVYAAAQQRWLEVSSVSNFETYQANRMKLRYRDGNGKIHLLHTLNGSALALPRIVAALLENNQDEKGIRIPKALIPYTGFDRIS